MFAALGAGLLSPITKCAVFLALVLSVAASGYMLLKQHDANVLAQQNLVTQQAEAVEQAAHAQRTIATLQQENAQAMAEAASSSAVKRSIANATNSSACAGSAPVGAALRGLQQPSGSGHAAKGKPASSNVAVPAGAR